MAIDEIEETSKDKFLRTYASVNKELKNFFPILFPNGEATLPLLSQRILLTLELKLLFVYLEKNAEYASFLWREKALTAIALIFALLKSKPTPFCFLDEVGTALDETNVSRYNKVLEALSDRFQFIVITHRRRTMEVLDTLYGVTMQEPGVSKVVGVDMNKALPSHLQKAFKDQKNNAKRPQHELVSDNAKIKAINFCVFKWKLLVQNFRSQSGEFW